MLVLGRVIFNSPTSPWFSQSHPLPGDHFSRQTSIQGIGIIRDAHRGNPGFKGTNSDVFMINSSRYLVVSTSYFGAWSDMWSYNIICIYIYISIIYWCNMNWIEARNAQLLNNHGLWASASQKQIWQIWIISTHKKTDLRVSKTAKRCLRYEGHSWNSNPPNPPIKHPWIAHGIL